MSMMIVDHSSFCSVIYVRTIKSAVQVTLVLSDKNFFCVGKNRHRTFIEAIFTLTGSAQEYLEKTNTCPAVTVPAGQG
jgi:hypothetical protein